MGKLQFFSDKDSISLLPTPLADTMKEEGIIAPDHSSAQFCGFVSWTGGTAVFLPVNCCETNFNALTAHFLLRALRRYYDDKETGVYEGVGSELIGTASLSLILSLVDDYLENGLYVRRARERTLNSGKINWSRTISRQVGFLSNNAPVYLDLETSRTHYVSDCETARIHASIIRDIYSEYSEILFGGARASDVDLELMPSPSGELITQLAHLDRELPLIYSDRDINLVNSLRRYLERSSGKDNPSIIGTRNFHAVWEGMIDQCLPRRVSGVNSKLPIPFYFSNGSYVPVAKKGQRTDTVIENEDGSHIAVVDAKYYRAQDSNSAPGWTDIVKQIFYKTAVESIVPQSTNVSLHFVFPGDKQVLDSAHVGSRANHPVKLKPSGDYPDIHCNYCDPVKLMKDYVNGVKDYTLSNKLLSIR
jgi:hypothetical protein